MRILASCLLLLCSLAASGEDAGVTAESQIAPSPALKSAQELAAKLEWNVALTYWDNLVGNGATAAPSAHSESSSAGGLFSSNFDFSSGTGAASEGTMQEADVERILQTQPKRDGLQLGQSDYALRSPILEGLIPRRAPPDASLGRRFLNLPIVRWFVPRQMPEPPGGGKYFKWGERAEPWQDVARPAPSPGAMDNGLYH